MEPTARWECYEEEEMDITPLRERLRFPYASNVVAPNRIMKSAMSEQLSIYKKDDMKKNGIPTQELINLYEKFADGGFGIIVTGCIMINGKDIEAPGNVIIDREFDSEERRTAFQKWTQCTKRNGSIFIAQLFHPGKYAADLPHKTGFDINKLTPKQIGDLINDYAYAASFAQQCGFNGVEISCAYFFALGQFITSGANNRHDEFGGELDNRAKVLFKIIQAIRMKISQPSRFVIGLKLFCGNFEPGFKNDVFGDFIHNIEKTGFDYITITGGHYNLIKDLKHTDDPKKCEYFYQKFVLSIKNQLTRTKLIMNGGFVTLPDMIAAVRDGWAAGVSLGRPVAAEPDLPKRFLNGEVRSAAKSLFDPLDYSIAQQFAGSQLWQHACLLIVMDASNPDHIEQFKKDLHSHEKQKAASGESSQLVIGYPKTIVHPELLDEDLLKNIQHSLITPVETTTQHGYEPRDEPVTTIEDFQNEMIEEGTHHVMKKQLDDATLRDVQKKTVEDAVHTIVKRHEHLEDGGVEIIEETIEKMVRTQASFSEPPPQKYNELQHLEKNQSLGRNQQSKQIGSTKDDSLSGNVVETLDISPQNTKSTIDSTFEKSAELVNEVFKDITEGQFKEDKPIADVAANEGGLQEMSLQISKETVGEMIAGLSDDDKPIICGIVENHETGSMLYGSDTDTVIHQSKYTGICANEEEELLDKQKYPVVGNRGQYNDYEITTGGEKHVINTSAIQEDINKKIYDDMICEMKTPLSPPLEPMVTTSELSSRNGNEQFEDASHVRNPEYNETLNDGDRNLDLGEDHTKNMAASHMPEYTKIQEIYGNDSMKGINEDHQVDESVKNDSLSEATLPKGVMMDENALSHVVELKDGHLENQFSMSAPIQSGLEGSLNDADDYKISLMLSSTLFGSSLPGENGSTVAYGRCEDQSALEQLHGKNYNNSCTFSDKPKDVANAEQLHGEQTDITQMKPELGIKISTTKNSVLEKISQGNKLAELITSAVPDSVQNLLSSTKDKFDEIFNESDKKQQTQMQLTTTEVMVDDKCKTHTESYTATDADQGLFSDSGNNEAAAAGSVKSDRFKEDYECDGDSVSTYQLSETSITTITDGKKNSKKHPDELYGEKKSTDELDFEFIH